MSEIDEYKWLKSEEAQLKEFLKELPKDDIFMRPGFEHRLKEVKERLCEFEERKVEMKKGPVDVAIAVAIGTVCGMILSSLVVGIYFLSLAAKNFVSDYEVAKLAFGHFLLMWAISLILITAVVVFREEFEP